MSQKCKAAAPKANWILACICRSITRRDNRCDHPTLPSACQAPPGVMCPQLKEDRDRLEKVQKTATKTIKWLENLPYVRRVKELGLVSLEKIQGRPHHSTSGQLQRDQGLSLHKKLLREDKGQQLKVALGEVSSRHKRNFFNEINDWNKLPRDMAESPSLEVFKTQPDRKLDNLI